MLAVVVLLAVTKRSMVAVWARAAPSWAGDQWMRGRFSQARRTSEETAERAAAMANGCQSMTLMNSPALLHRKAVATMARIPDFMCAVVSMAVASLMVS